MLVSVQAFRGFVKLKKIQKIRENPEVGGWVKPQLGFCFFGGNCVVFRVFCIVLMFPNVKIKNWLMGWVGVV